MSIDTIPPAIANMKSEQLPIPDHQLHGWTHFLGLYAGEHVAATEFVIGATFVALGATTKDILIGLLIGNVLAILSWTLITAPIAVQTRLSLYTYLHKIAGDDARRTGRIGSATPHQTNGRETQVFRKIGNAWKIVHVHYSNMPVTGKRDRF